ncbi:hypothetical protein H5392_01295 [Tessaracoccus sp. MC1865]|uniref:endonuclease domain-containing protein n=1 Tax=Tessaracoccus sp. MC1865 TaxID=2760310 RepID=UPI0016007A70|nr:endonuclease domain-containing protein [Tessaracoccus sp. MC1865]MBB1482492.1 hypothetical protein [Tessaracoccus sp. MC1865]QTO38053.1 hypothetical protein J7D54_02795 [Tessaracoccus sp. MC1865]
MECRTATYRGRYRDANRESARAVYAGFTRQDWRDRNLRMKYGISLDEWEAMFEAQGRKCFFGCSEHGNHNWSTDHDHETGKVRAILCAKHNTMVGYIEKNAADLADVLLYIETHKITEEVHHD